MARIPSRFAQREVLDLTGHRGLVVSIANDRSLAWSAAKHFWNAGWSSPFPVTMTRRLKGYPSLATSQNSAKVHCL